MLPLWIALQVAAEDARRLAVLLLVVALDGGEIERVLGELRLLAEGDAEKELDGLAADLGVRRLHENRSAVEIGVGRVLALGVEAHGLREHLWIVRGGAEVVERGGADVRGNAIGVEHLELGRALLGRAGKGAHKPRAVCARGSRELLEELAIRLARLGGVPKNPVALGKSVKKLFRGNGLFAAQRRVLGLRRGTFAAVEETVGHRETVGGKNRYRGKEDRGKRHSSPSELSVASEKFQIPAARHVSMSSTSDS